MKNCAIIDHENNWSLSKENILLKSNVFFFVYRSNFRNDLNNKLKVNRTNFNIVSHMVFNIKYYLFNIEY